MHTETIAVPLRDHTGTTIAHATIDHDDGHLLAHSWYLDHHCRDKPYAKRRIYGVGGQFLHRAVLGLQPGDPERVDHINGLTLDCRKANLRLATTAENAQNQGSRGGSSTHRGVTWDKSRGKWMATAMLKGKRTTIGRFATEDEAGAAASAWRARHMPFSADAR